MSTTEKLIRQLKRSINPTTGRGYEYGDIAKVLNMTRQGLYWHITKQDHDCPKCLRRLKKTQTKK